jgi:trans-aconitate methyltransferase
VAADDAARALTGLPPRFDGESHATSTAHHRDVDADVLAGVALGAGDRVLDLGCGVGDLTARLATAVDAGGPAGGWVLGLDASPSCAAVAARTHRRTGLAFAAALAQDVHRLLPQGCLDVVVSVATLHAVPRGGQPVVLAGLARALRPGGSLRVDMGGHGQLAAVRSALAGLAREAGAPECPWYFPTAPEYALLLAEAGFAVQEVRLVRQRRRVPDEAALRRWMESQVLPAWTAHLPEVDRQDWVRAAVEAFTPVARHADGSFDQDDVRLHARAVAAAPGAGHDFPGKLGEAADAMAATTRKLTALAATGVVPDELRALWDKRLGVTAALARHDPAAALRALGQLDAEVSAHVGRVVPSG